MAVYKIESEEISVCPICGGRFLVIGVRKRQMINEAGDKEVLIIRRLRCKEEQCRRIHHELPDCLYPYKRHCAETIENIITGKAEETSCDINEASKIKQWWIALYPYLLSVLYSLNEKHGTGFDHNTPPREVVRAVVNSHLWIHTRSLVTPSRGVGTIIPKPRPVPLSKTTGE